jgi:hypothetical protein
METIKQITDRLTAARNTFADANADWDDKKSTPEAQAAQQRFNAARRALEAAQYDFSSVLTELKQRSLLRLAIDTLDQETTMKFRRLIAYLKLDSFTEPVSFASFADLAMSWFDARTVRDAAMHFSQLARECVSAAEFNAQLRALTEQDEEEERFTAAIERYRFILDLLTQSGEDADAQWETAVQKMFSRARAEVDELDGLLRANARRMSQGDFRKALLDLPDDVGLLVRRAIDGDWMPEPELQRQAQLARTAVATLTSEAEESAEEVGLTPEAEAQVDELLRSLEDKRE